MGFWRLIGEIALFKAVLDLFRDKPQHMDVPLQQHYPDCDHKDYADYHIDTYSSPDRYDDFQDELDNLRYDFNDMDHDNDFDFDDDW